VQTDQRVAILVDCDNTNPAALDYVMQCAAECGRVVLKRAYGNHATLANRWKDSLLPMGFAPYPQFPYATGKNTADIALALDALEALLDRRADCFLVVTSDSDFVQLCHKLRERGAAVHVVGEAKTPDALRGACDRFFGFVPAEAARAVPVQPRAALAPAPALPAASPEAQPAFVIDAVSRLSSGAPDGWVHLGALGHYLSGVRPGFKSKHYGYPKLIDMLRAYPLLEVRDQGGQAWTVRLAPRAGRKAA
jgi:hypothetical protein